MKFCPECGSQLQTGTAKFCHNCGTNLWAATTGTGNTVQPKEELKTIPEESLNLRKEGEEKEQVKGDFQTQTIHSLGMKLEETVEQILKSRGYNTETRKKMIGNSKALHE